MNIEIEREPFESGSVRAAMKYRSACTPLVMNILLPFSTQSPPVAPRPGADATHIGAGVGLRDSYRGNQLAAMTLRR